MAAEAAEEPVVPRMHDTALERKRRERLDNLTKAYMARHPSGSTTITSASGAADWQVPPPRQWAPRRERGPLLPGELRENMDRVDEYKRQKKALEAGACAALGCVAYGMVCAFFFILFMLPVLSSILSAQSEWRPWITKHLWHAIGAMEH
jgi:hypothetical protein